MKHVTEQDVNDKTNRIISFFILGIYFSLVVFFFISVSSPGWLKKVSSIGKESEAKDIKDYGDRFLDTRQYDMAIAQYKNAILINPDFAEAYSNLGIAYRLKGDFKNALTNFDKALSFKDKLHDVTYYNIAEVLIGYGKNNEAVKYYLKSAQIAPYPVYSYQKAGELLNNLKQWEMASEAFDMAIESRFSMKNCYMGMLKKNYSMYEDQEIKEVLKEQLDKGIDEVNFSTYDEIVFSEQEKNNHIMASIYNQYGFTYAQTGKMDKAIECFKKALDVIPDFENARKNLEMAYSLQKKK